MGKSCRISSILRRYRCLSSTKRFCIRKVTFSSFFPAPSLIEYSVTLLIPLLSLLATGLLTGNEIAVALFIHPVLYRVPDAAHATVVQPLAAKLGRWMPFW